jgi:hypothetical protein
MTAEGITCTSASTRTHTPLRSSLSNRCRETRCDERAEPVVAPRRPEQQREEHSWLRPVWCVESPQTSTSTLNEACGPSGPASCRHPDNAAGAAWRSPGTPRWTSRWRRSGGSARPVGSSSSGMAHTRTCHRGGQPTRHRARRSDAVGHESPFAPGRRRRAGPRHRAHPIRLAGWFRYPRSRPFFARYRPQTSHGRCNGGSMAPSSRLFVPLCSGVAQVRRRYLSSTRQPRSPAFIVLNR